jgi:Zn-dependent M28 family amino/carboxypeptidase
VVGTHYGSTRPNDVFIVGAHFDSVSNPGANDNGSGLTGVIGGALNASDHSPFEDYGYQACLLIEHGYGSNPYYHTQYDSVDMPGYIDYVYATNMVCSTVRFLATAAVPIPEPATMLLLVFGVILTRKRPD